MGLHISCGLEPQKEAVAPDNAKRITLLPLGNNVSQKFIQTTYAEIKKFLPTVELAPTAKLPGFAYNSERGRYRAATKGQYADWGVMGLGFRPGKAAVASDFRMSNKSAFWKIAIHELGHTSGLPHCPVKTCFMRDAEGGNPTAEEKEFCSKCKKTLLNQGWIL